MPDVRQRKKGAEEADASTSAAASSGPAPVARAKPRVPRLGRAVLWTGCFYIFMFAFVWAFCALAPRFSRFPPLARMTVARASLPQTSSVR